MIPSQARLQWFSNDAPRRHRYPIGGWILQLFSSFDLSCHWCSRLYSMRYTLKACYYYQMRVMYTLPEILVKDRCLSVPLSGTWLIPFQLFPYLQKASYAHLSSSQLTAEKLFVKAQVFHDLHLKIIHSLHFAPCATSWRFTNWRFPSRA